MESLSQKILDAARDEVLRDHKIEMTWEEYIDTFPSSICIPDYLSEAALLAMERQASFFRWAFKNYSYYDSLGIFSPKDSDRAYTELELYNIWREQK